MTSECPVSGHVFGAKDYTEIKQAMLVLKLVGFEIVSHQQLLFIGSSANLATQSVHNRVTMLLLGLPT